MGDADSTPEAPQPLPVTDLLRVPGGDFAARDADGDGEFRPVDTGIPGSAIRNDLAQHNAVTAAAWCGLIQISRTRGSSLWVMQNASALLLCWWDLALPVPLTHTEALYVALVLYHTASFPVPIGFQHAAIGNWAVGYQNCS